MRPFFWKSEAWDPLINCWKLYFCFLEKLSFGLLCKNLQLALCYGHDLCSTPFRSADWLVMGRYLYIVCPFICFGNSVLFYLFFSSFVCVCRLILLFGKGVIGVCYYHIFRFTPCSFSCDYIFDWRFVLICIRAYMKAAFISWSSSATKITQRNLQVCASILGSAWLVWILSLEW